MVHIADDCRAIRGLLESKLGVKSRDLGQGVRRAGRRLPRRVRAQAAVLVAAERQSGHPRLARQIDGDRIARAREVVSAHLNAIDVADARKGRWLSLAGALAFNLIAVGAAFVWWLWWRGYV